MFSVVIVEDEKLIRDEIEQSTPWHSLGLTVVGTASDGIEGEAVIRRTNPDIVITDIRLPGQDGLEMLETCVIEHAIILSGHSDFKYMRKAIKLGVFDYLLKPFDDEDFEAALASLVQKLHEEEAQIAALGTNKGHIDLPLQVDNHIVNSAIQIIAKDYNKNMGLQETAAMLNLSESHLSRIFKEHTNINFLQYLQAWRINNALELLKDSRMNIGMISTLCGFPTPGYFTKVFKRFKGVTPSQFRDNQG
ncbi:MAG: helix-turn-helix domain-containing protein [Sphaerochaetaceae bacterium]|jgi:two-component system response regulator YesN|nr:helix-turn-helix domain-containing protein [Sphaerochaetaceae bacterium]MDD4218736.1 helix-turn-helix domain-containing protein [Sphaerochaetaceae bacterium]MDY0370874.1 helix-turn-helix domain-containing protein [Sphaerochaetaceae bacterium]